MAGYAHERKPEVVDLNSRCKRRNNDVQRNRNAHLPAKSARQVGHTAAKSRLLRFAAHLVVAFAIARAVMVKPRNENVSGRSPCTWASRCAKRPNLISLVLLGSRASANLFSRLHVVEPRSA